MNFRRGDGIYEQSDELLRNNFNLDEYGLNEEKMRQFIDSFDLSKMDDLYEFKIFETLDKDKYAKEKKHDTFKN